MIRKSSFGIPSFTPDFIIGGEGVNTTSASELETLLNLIPGEITNFAVIGVDVHAIISVNYIIPANAFNSNTDITSYLDNEGKCTGILGAAFFLASSLVEVNFPEITNTDASAFRNTALTSVTLPKLTSSGSNVFLDCSNLVSITLNIFTATVPINFCKNCTSLTTFITSSTVFYEDSCFNGCTSLTSVPDTNVVRIDPFAFYGCSGLSGTITLPNLTTLGVNSLQNCTGITGVDFQSLTRVSSEALRGCTSLSSIVIPNLTRTDASAMRGTAITSVSFPLLTSCYQNNFYNCTSATNIYMPLCVILGHNVLNNTVFLNLKLNCIITVDIFLQTNNGGGRDGDIAYAEDVRSATIVYV